MRRFRLVGLVLSVIAALIAALSVAAPATARPAKGSATAATAPSATAPAGVTGTAQTEATEALKRALEKRKTAWGKPAFDSRAAKAAIERLVGGEIARKLTLRASEKVNGEEFFRVSADPQRRLVIEGTSNAVLLTGFNWYLKYVAKSDISWDAGQVSFDKKTMPLPSKAIVQRANVGVRLYGNDIWTDYTSANWTWKEWERELDVLALQGYNTVFMPIGLEDVAHRTLEEFGYSRAETLKWTAPLAHNAAGMWQGGWTLADGGISEQVQQARVELGQKIVTRMRELGMTPLMPGFVGFVPEDFAQRNPGANVVDRGYWFSQRMLSWLDPRTPKYAEVAARFYAIQKEMFGTTTMYAMNPFTEGGKITFPLEDAGVGIQAALQKANPGAIWQMHAWQDNPRGSLISGLDPKTTFVVDFNSDRYAGLDREKQWGGTPYAYGGVWNFGGHTTMGGNLGVWNTDYYAWLNKPNSAVRGIALSPEGGHGDVLPLEFFAELAWRDGPADLTQWYRDYGTRRYGGEDEHASKAWEIMGRTAYALPKDGWDEAQDGLFAGRPSFTRKSAAAWSPEYSRYDMQAFAQALQELLKVAPELRDTDTYRLDLMMVARQVLDNNSRIMLPRIKAAYDAKDLERFRALSEEWLEQIRLQDAVARTQVSSLLGPWVEQARAAGATPEEKAKLVIDAKEVLTTWGGRELSEAGLRDYCNRSWNGLIGTLYLPRWEKYLGDLEKALVTGTEPVKTDWFAVDRAWVEDVDATFPTTAAGDIHALATEVWNRYEALTR